jgi:apolipoprotein N-acyltransferase
MHEIWRISISAGAGAALGVAAAGLLARSARAPLAAAVLALAAAGALAWLVFDWKAAIAGAAGGLLGGFGAGVFVRGAVRRGGTWSGTAVLLVGAAAVAFALALIPIVGFLEAAAIPAFALRARRRAGEKYAGLRTLAK